MTIFFFVLLSRAFSMPYLFVHPVRDLLHCGRLNYVTEAAVIF